MADANGEPFAVTPPVGDLIGNLMTDRRRVRVGPHLLPMTVNDGAPTCYICCPSTAWLDYAREELRLVALPAWLKSALGLLIWAARPLLHASGLDNQVQPNNALFATNLLPDLRDEDIADVTRRLSEQWPDKTIVWRSICDEGLLERFAAAGYTALPVRQVYLFDARHTPPKAHKDEKNDARLLRHTSYSRVAPGDLGDADFDRLIALYGQLYLEKYSILNPRYTALFLRRAHADGTLHIEGLREAGGRLDAFVAFYRQGDNLTAPLIGYDTSLPQSLGLYRLIMTLCLERARANRLLYNMSAGAAAFKRSRGGVATIDHMVVYNRHLPWRKRMCVAIIAALLNGIVKPLLQRLKL